jgi:hypothetical protein
MNNFMVPNWPYAIQDDSDDQDCALTEEERQNIMASELNTVTTSPRPNNEEKKFELLDSLFEFINTETEINNVLAGYFNRLVNVLITNKSKEVLQFSNFSFLIMFSRMIIFWTNCVNMLIQRQLVKC